MSNPSFGIWDEDDCDAPRKHAQRFVAIPRHKQPTGKSMGDTNYQHRRRYLNKTFDKAKCEFCWRRCFSWEQCRCGSFVGITMPRLLDLPSEYPLMEVS